MEVEEAVKAQRYARFMETQQKISAKRLRAKVGKREPVIIDSISGNTAIGRTRGDAPEIDGVVHVMSRRPLKVGEIATVKIERAEHLVEICCMLLHGIAKLRRLVAVSRAQQVDEQRAAPA